MMFRVLLALLYVLFGSMLTLVSHADESNVKAFNSGSYQEILLANIDKPFILSVWSIDCPSCLKDMDVIYRLHQKHPDLTIILLSTDEPTTKVEVEEILSRFHLNTLENWMFGSDDDQKLRYEIDPAWYGELPRTYFLDQKHNRIAKSGAMNLNEFEDQIAKIKPN